MTNTSDNLTQIDRPALVGTSIVADPTTIPAETYLIELVADGDDATEGPASVRLKRWLKTGLRCHGLRCRGVRGVPDVSTVGMAVTNARPGHWRPSGRAIRRATKLVTVAGSGPQISAGLEPRRGTTPRADRARGYCRPGHREGAEP